MKRNKWIMILINFVHVPCPSRHRQAAAQKKRRLNNLFWLKYIDPDFSSVGKCSITTLTPIITTTPAPKIHTRYGP